MFYLEPDPVYQMGEVLCERRLAFRQGRQRRCSETGPLQILFKDHASVGRKDTEFNSSSTD